MGKQDYVLVKGGKELGRGDRDELLAYVRRHQSPTRHEGYQVLLAETFYVAIPSKAPPEDDDDQV